MTRGDRIRAASKVSDLLRREALDRCVPVDVVVPSSVIGWRQVAMRVNVDRLDTAGELLVLHDLGIPASYVTASSEPTR